MRHVHPPIWSRRFRHILALGLAGEPIRAVKGLYWILTGRRVRGYGQLAIAASGSRQVYSRWVKRSEPVIIETFRDEHPRGQRLNMSVLILDAQEHDAAATEITLESIREAFGPEAFIDQIASAADDRSVIPDVQDVFERLNRTDGCRWILPMVAGDTLNRRSAELLSAALASCSAPDLIYWDEDTLHAGRRRDPWLKPDWDDLLFSQVSGLTGATLVSLSAALEAASSLPCLPLSRAGIERILLAAGGAREGATAHVPLILTHRSAESSLPRILPVRELDSPQSAPLPLVSVIVPTRDRPDLIGPCLEGLWATDYPKLELIIVDNGTIDGQALRILEQAERNGATVIRDDGPFNFPRLNNTAAELASGEFLCFYNNDVEPIDPLWLRHLVNHGASARTGAVGALLLYPSGRIQHAGVAVGMGGAAGHIQKGARPHDLPFRTWHSITRQVTAVTAAVMLLRKTHFEAVGRFDEQAFPVAFNDVDLCLKLRSAGLRNIFVAEAKLLHRESESRGDDRRPERAANFAGELAALQDRWKTIDYRDPFFSPSFLRSSERLVLNS